MVVNVNRYTQYYNFDIPYSIATDQGQWSGIIPGSGCPREVIVSYSFLGSRILSFSMEYAQYFKVTIVTDEEELPFQPGMNLSTLNVRDINITDTFRIENPYLFGGYTLRNQLIGPQGQAYEGGISVIIPGSN